MTSDSQNGSAAELAQACALRMFADDRAVRDLGITVEIPAPGRAIARMAVLPGMVNGFGLCHGGYLFTLADTAFAYACNAYDRITVAAAASVEFLRPAHSGDCLVAEACERHRGRSQGVYDVVVRDGEGREVALFRGRSRASERPLLAAGGEAGPVNNDTENIEKS